MPEGDDPQAQCIFCHIVSGAVASKRVYEDEKVVAVLDINPANAGHILLMPREHFAFMPQLPEDLANHVGMVAKQLSFALIRSLKVTGTNIFVANGESAGQRALHVMVHIIPRMEGDGVVGLDIPLKNQSSESLVDMKKKLAQPIKDALGFEPTQASVPAQPLQAPSLIPLVSSPPVLSSSSQNTVSAVQPIIPSVLQQPSSN
ncbi:MAG: HIT domain-containing protein, partial [Candidatus Woesearchaeota archaeon]|nr:HIT domain-containing protein [Candidatus Woesearchaeota archaeon]